MLSHSTKTKFVLRTLGLAFLLSFTHTAFAQLTPISLEQRIEKSTTIFEGKVVSHASYWDEAKSSIYTLNVVDVYKVFKGQVTTKQIELITKGGILGNKMQRVSHSLELKISDVGVFTAIPSTSKLGTQTNFTKLRTYAGVQGFIKYDLVNKSASDVFNNYKNITKELYSKIVAHTKTSIKTVQKTPFKI